jgi:hypothetical protein
METSWVLLNPRVSKFDFSTLIESISKRKKNHFCFSRLSSTTVVRTSFNTAWNADSMYLRVGPVIQLEKYLGKSCDKQGDQMRL